MESGKGRRRSAAAEAVAESLLTFLAGGIVIDAPGKDFIASQLGEASPGVLSDVLGDEAHPDYDTVLDYLLTPPRSVRLSIEALLVSHERPCSESASQKQSANSSGAAGPPARVAAMVSNAPALVPQGIATGSGTVAPVLPTSSTFSADDGIAPAARPTLTQAVIGLLHERVKTLYRDAAASAARHDGLCVAVWLDGVCVAQPALPEWAIGVLARRLRLDAGRSPAVASAVASVLDDASRDEVMLLLRDCRVPHTHRHDELIRLFFCGIPMSIPERDEALRLWLGIIEHMPEDGDPVLRLRQRRDRLERALREAEHFSEQLARYNIETLMLQGVRPPALDIAVVRCHMDILNRLCVGMFGVSCDGEMPAGPYAAAARGDDPFDPQGLVAAFFDDLR